MSTCYHLIFDVYPAWDSIHVSKWAGAAASCFVSAEIANASELAERSARARLEMEGWHVATVVRIAVVSEEDYEPGMDGAVEFQSALKHGYAAHFFVRHREVVSLLEASDEQESEILSQRVLEDFLQNQQIWVLEASSDRQIAVGVTPDGDDFVPIWPNQEGALAWLQAWPDHVARRFSITDLMSELRTLTDTDTWLGVGSATSIVTVHPRLFLDQLSLKNQAS